MSRKRTAGGAVATLTVALVLTACSSEDDAAPTLPPTTHDVTRTTQDDDPTETTTAPADDTTATTTAPPTLSPQEQDEADATAALVEYHRVLDAVAQGEAEIEALNPVAIGTAREQWITQFMLYREQGWTQEGEVVLEVLEVTHVDEDQVDISTCSDVSGVDVLDEDGESIVTVDRPDESLVDFVLERDEDAEHGWVVVEDVNRDEPCDAE